MTAFRPLFAGLAAALLFAAAGPSAAVPAPERLAALPLVELPVSAPGDTLAVLYSGDGGWAAIDQGVAAGLTQAGVPVVGLDSLRYFWTGRTPDAAAQDLAAVLEQYMTAWGRSKVILAGYSFGADALPAIVAHLPPRLRGHVRVVALVGVAREGELKFRPASWLSLPSPDAYAIAPVLRSLGDVPRVCIYGDAERHDACPTFAAGLARPIRLAGNHHFDGHYAPISAAILRSAGL